jgi:hypothetical protein
MLKRIGIPDRSPGQECALWWRLTDLRDRGTSNGHLLPFSMHLLENVQCPSAAQRSRNVACVTGPKQGRCGLVLDLLGQKANILDACRAA